MSSIYTKMAKILLDSGVDSLVVASIFPTGTTSDIVDADTKNKNWTLMIDDYMARIISHLDDSRANFTDWASDFLANDLRRLFSDINGSKTPVADDVLINFSMLTLLIGNKILKDHGLNNVNWHISNLGGYMLSQGIVGIAWLLLKHYPADLMLNAHAMTIKLLLDFNKKDLAACLARSLYKDLNYSMDYLRSYFGIYLY